MRFWVCQRQSTPQRDYKPNPPQTLSPLGQPNTKNQQPALKVQKRAASWCKQSLQDHGSDGSVETCRN